MNKQGRGKTSTAKRRAISDMDKAQRRLDVLNAALDVFFEKGFAAARMDEIAKRAGVSKGTVYLYFPSKEALFEAQITAIAQPRAMQIEQILSTAKTAKEGLQTFLQLLPRIILTSPVPKLFKIMIADAGNFPAAVQVYRQQVIDRALGAMTAFLRNAHERGEFHVPAPEYTARVVIAPLLMSVIWRLVFSVDGDDDLNVAALFAEHERVLLRALQP